MYCHGEVITQLKVVAKKCCFIFVDVCFVVILAQRARMHREFVDRTFSTKLTKIITVCGNCSSNSITGIFRFVNSSHSSIFVVYPQLWCYLVLVLIKRSYQNFGIHWHCVSASGRNRGTRVYYIKEISSENMKTKIL